MTDIKTFFKKWGEGIQKITPLQQSKINLIGNILVIIGVLIGLYATWISKTRWLFVILCGSFLLTSMGLLANYQKYVALKKIEQDLNVAEVKDENSKEKEADTRTESIDRNNP